MFYGNSVSPLVLALLATTMFTQPGAAHAAPGDPQGDEFQVNSHTTGDQWLPSVAMDADGDFVVVWSGVGASDSDGVFAQRFDAAGVAQGSEFRVNSLTSGAQSSPAVAMDAGGNFVIAWMGLGLGDSQGIYARRFDAAAAVLGPEFRVNSFTTGNQDFPAVAMDANGDFVVTWSGSGLGDDHGVFARRFDATGTAKGGEVRVNGFTTDLQRTPAVAMDADGDFIVAWQGAGANDTYGIFARGFDAAGVPQKGEIQVNTYTTSVQFQPAVAMKPDGEFVVVWASDSQDGDGWGVYTQRFNAAGARQGSESLVNSFTPSNQWFPSVAVDADGDFVVAWEDAFLDGSSAGIFGQRFDAQGGAVGPEFGVNGFTSFEQRTPAVVMDADGDFVVAWQSYGPDGDSLGISARRYDGAERIAADFNGDGNADVLWRRSDNGATVLWLMEGTTKVATPSIGNPGIHWRIDGIGDFNGDGKSDVLWRNTSGGNVVLWLMDGATKMDSRGIGVVPTVWEIETLDDTNGDGLSDIVWRNGTSGSTIVWQMSGFTRLATGGNGTVPTVWEVQ